MANNFHQRPQIAELWFTFSLVKMLHHELSVSKNICTQLKKQQSLYAAALDKPKCLQKSLKL